MVLVARRSVPNRGRCARVVWSLAAQLWYDLVRVVEVGKIMDLLRVVSFIFAYFVVLIEVLLAHNFVIAPDRLHDVGLPAVVHDDRLRNVATSGHWHA